jgi:hypothetical protein
MEIYCDNNGVIAQAKEPRSHQKKKHIIQKYHLIRECVEEGEITLCKIHTNMNVSDPLRKTLSLAKHNQQRDAIGVRQLYVNKMIDYSASGGLFEICSRCNNKLILFIFLCS